MDFRITKDNRKQVSNAVNDAILRALEICGGMCESNAKDNLTRLKAVDTGNLRNSMSHVVDANEQKVYIGSTQKIPPYGIYVEMGTGINVQGGRRTSWTYKDSKGKWHKTNGMKPRPFLKPALEEHQKEYQNVFVGELGKL